MVETDNKTNDLQSELTNPQARSSTTKVNEINMKYNRYLQESTSIFSMSSESSQALDDYRCRLKIVNLYELY